VYLCSDLTLKKEEYEKQEKQFKKDSDHRSGIYFNQPVFAFAIQLIRSS